MNLSQQEKDWETSEKAQSANIFREYWKKARENKVYLQMKNNFRNEKTQRLNTK